MTLATIALIVGLLATLLGIVGGALVYAFKVGGMVRELAQAIIELSKVKATVDSLALQFPVILTRLGQVEEDVSAQRKKLSDYPAMRERLSSVNEEVSDIHEELSKKNLAERTAANEHEIKTLRTQIESIRNMRAMVPRPMTIPRTEEK